MEKYDRHEIKKPDKPYDPLEPWKLKHCELFEKCLDNCADCLFKEMHKLNPEPWLEKDNDKIHQN